MNKEEIKTSINFFKKVIEENAAEINVMMVNHNSSRKKAYKGLMLKTKLEPIKSTLLLSLNFLLDEFEKKSLDTYDLEISLDNSIQMASRTDVIHGEEILEDISIKYTKENTVSEDTDLTKIKFIVIQIFADNQSIYLYKKYVQPTTVYKRSQKYTISGGILKPFKEKVITIDTSVDAFLLGDTYYVLNRNAFNSIFEYKDVYSKIIHDNEVTICNSKLMTNPKKFMSDCESDGRYLTRLTKVILAKGFDEVAKNKSDIPKVIKEFNLALKTSSDGEVIYEGKENISELLNLLMRHYVIDALTSNKMIAVAIQDYQAGNKGGV